MVFGSPLDPLEEWLYLLVQVQHESPSGLQVPGARGIQERGIEELLEGQEVDVSNVESYECFDSIGGGFGSSLEPLEYQMHLFVHVHY